MTEKQMREHMKQERFSGMYFFHGAESYVLSRYLELLIKKTVGSRQSPGFSCFDEESITIMEENAPRTFNRAEIALIRLAIDF